MFRVRKPPPTQVFELAAKLEIINISSFFVAGFWKFLKEKIEANVARKMLSFATEALTHSC
jgi:hypothetical protein